MKVRMVLEGGAFRGLFTAGVLDVLMENNINVDEIVGVSAGALFGVNYFTNQKGRVIRYNLKYCGQKRYMSAVSLVLTGNFINKKFTFYKITKELDILDNETFTKNNKPFYAVVTNVVTGKPEYKLIKNPIVDLEIFRATSAVPLASRFVKLDNKKYLDGGISDSIPVYFHKDKYDKSIVILTQPLGYKKKMLAKNNRRLIKLKYFKYPNLLKTMYNRHNAYNKVLKDIKEMEKNKEIFVIRPEKSLNISMNVKDKNKVKEIYDHGVEVGNKIIKDLKNYLEVEVCKK